MKILPKEIADKLHHLGWYQQLSDDEFYDKIQPTTTEAWNWCVIQNLLKIQSMRADSCINGYPCYNHIVLDNGVCFDTDFKHHSPEGAMEDALYYALKNNLFPNEDWKF